MANDVMRSLEAYSLGLGGFEYLEGAVTKTGKYFAIQVLAETTYRWEGVTGSGTASVANLITIPAGTIIYGQFSSVIGGTTSSKALCYNVATGG